MLRSLQVLARPGLAGLKAIKPAARNRTHARRYTGPRNAAQAENHPQPTSSSSTPQQQVATSVDPAVLERRLRRQREQVTYKFAAIAATVGLTVLAIAATYARFSWHVDTGEHSGMEIFCTLALVFGGAIGMEMWARFAHKTLWHDYAPGWALHKSHHEPRIGPFEANDVFALVNGVPACALCAYGFFTPSMLGGVCFGAGLGITLFGIAYMFIHDGLVHRRFPVGPIAEWPYLKRVAVAHQLHHSDKFDGAPWGLFLGPQELDAIPGATEELDRLVEQLDFSKR